MLQEKANEMLIKHDPKTMNKSTKILAPLQTSNTMGRFPQPIQSQKTLESNFGSVASPIMFQDHGMGINQGNAGQYLGGDNQTVNFNINIGLNFQSNNVTTTVQNQARESVNGKLESKVELDDLLNELDNNEVSNSQSALGIFAKSTTLDRYNRDGNSPAYPIGLSNYSQRAKGSEMSAVNETIRTDGFSHQNTMTTQTVKI